MNHYLVLVLTDVLDWVALTGVAIKGRNHELFGEFIFQYGFREGRIGHIYGDGLEFTVMRRTHILDSLLYELVEILDMDECLSSPSRLIRLNLHVGMRT